MLTARLEKLGLKRGAWVLDLGCGEGRHVHGLHVLGGINVVGLDRDGPSLAKAQEGLAMLPAATATTGFVEGDAYRTPYADATFDAVICSEVLEHLEDYHAALAEIARVLKPGGVFVATVPRAWPERICWALASGPGGYGDQPGGHVRIFDERELAADIAKGGFDKTGRHHAHGLHAPYWWLKCAFWDRRDDHPLVKLYHRFLVWDLMERPWLTRALDAVASPVMGKSVALYFRKRAAA
ncbi:MAG: class I SAM-dependent methyltransferase [Caulobacteraceae bacterium]|nr:MAG: class I SAM-dependent methyltransferase [Caulobacteraceae bacterium]